MPDARVPILAQGDMEAEVEGFLRRRFGAIIRDVELVAREDMDLKNHLSGLQRRLLKVYIHIYI